jgi:co-chaperonin GroES (HSP10)
MQNTSGIYPLGDRVLIKPDEIEKTSPGGIIIVDPEERHAMAQSIGIVVAVGPDCWVDHVEVERGPDGARTRKVGFSEPFAKPGDRVCFAKYGGLQVPGRDGALYRIMNDVDITARVDDEVDFTDLKPRTAFHEGSKR